MKKPSLIFLIQLLLIFPINLFAQTFTEVTNTTYNGFQGTYYSIGTRGSSPCFADMDNDGDKDLLIGTLRGRIRYYRNDDIDTNVGGSDNIIDKEKFILVNRSYISISGLTSLHPAVADLDNDGNIDIIVGTDSGTLYFYKNTGTLVGGAPSLASKVDIGVTVGQNATPALDKIDSDNDYDMLVGTSDGSVSFLRNTGDETAFSFTLESSDLLNTKTGYNSTAPSFGDIDGDGDAELFVGNSYGQLLYYEKNVSGSDFSFQLISTSYNSIDVGDNCNPDLIDLDGDGDYDLFVGSYKGNITYYKNNGTTSSASFSLANDMYAFFEFDDNSTPLFVDLDNDGDKDLLISTNNDIAYFRNVGNNVKEAWELVSLSYLKPTRGKLRIDAWDFDLDGDYDLFFGTDDGGIGYFENIGTSSSPSFIERKTGFKAISANLFDNMKSPFFDASVRFFDADGDGDKDCVIFNVYGTSTYYRNDDIDINQGGTDDSLDGWSEGDFVLVDAGNAMNDSFVKVIIEGSIIPAIWDIDSDGDNDFLLGYRRGKIIYCQNTGTVTSPNFTQITTSYANLTIDPYDSLTSYSSIDIADINGDGWFDIVLGGFFGGLRIFTNDNGADLVNPSQPQNFIATAMRHDRVKLTWDRVIDSETGVDYYKIKRFVGTSSTPETTITLKTPTPLTYYDIGLTQSTDYNYEISAVDRAGNESVVATASASTGLPPQLDHFDIIVPTGLQPGNFNITINAIDNYGFLFDSFNESVNLSVSSGSLDKSSVALVNGTKTVNLIYSETNPSGEVIINITVSNTGNTITKVSGDIHLDIISPMDPVLSSATATAENEVLLIFSGGSDAGGSPDHYLDIYRNNVLIKTLDHSDTLYRDNTVVASTTYTYKLRGRDTVGNVSNYSTEIEVTTPEPAIDDTPPSIPTNLRKVSVGSDFIAIAWDQSTDAGSGVDYYEIYRGPTLIANVSTNYYTDSGLDPSTSYTYHLKAVDNAGNISSFSEGLTLSTDSLNGDTSAPTVPGGFNGEQVDNTSIKLNWNPSVDSGGSGLAGYQIFRQDYANYNSPIGVVNSSTTSFTNVGLTPGNSYTYRIRAYDGAGNYSDFTGSITINMVDDTVDITPPSVPDGLSATILSPYDVRIDWNPSTDNQGVASYKIYEFYSNGWGSGYIYKGESNETTFTVNELESGKKYTYSVKAIDTSGNMSDYSSGVTFTMPDVVNDDTPPSSPSNLRFVETTFQHVILEFDPSVDNEGGSGVKQYLIYRNGDLLSTISSTQYVDDDVVENQSYSYYVIAEDFSENKSQPSETLTTVIPEEDNTPPTTPSNLKVDYFENKIILSWDVSYDEGSGVGEYEVVRYKSGSSSSSETALTTYFSYYEDTNVAIGEIYSYLVRAKDRAGNYSSYAIIDDVALPDSIDDDYTVYFPHIDITDMWWTGFTLVNISDVDANVSFKFYSNEGELLVELDNLLVIKKGEKIINTIRGLLTEGDRQKPIAWLKVESDQKLDGFELFGTNTSEEMVGVKISNKSMTKMIFPSITVDDEKWTGVALINVGDNQGDAIFKAYDNLGNLLAESNSVQLNSYGKTVDLVENYFDGEIPAGTSYVKVESTFEMIGFELFGYKNQLGLAGLSGVDVNEVIESQTKVNENSLYSAELEGPSNIQAIVLGGNSAKITWDAPTTGIPDSYEVWTADIIRYIDGTSNLKLKDKLTTVAGTSAYLNDLTSNTDYTVTVLSVYGNETSEINKHEYASFTTDFDTTEEKNIYVIPRIEDGQGFTEVNIVNLEVEIANVDLELFNEEGETETSLDITIPANGSYRFLVNEMFPAATKQDSIRIVSTKKLLAYEVFMNSTNTENFGFDTMFAFSKGLEKIYFSHIAPEINQFITELYIWNLNANENQLQFNLYKQNGELIATVNKSVNGNSVLKADVLDLFDSSLIEQQCWVEVVGQFPINGYYMFSALDYSRISAIEAE